MAGIITIIGIILFLGIVGLLFAICNTAGQYNHSVEAELLKKEYLMYLKLKSREVKGGN